MLLLAALASWTAAHAGSPPGHIVARVFGPSDGIVGGQIRALLESEPGVLYVGTEGGVCRFDGERCAQVPAPPGYESAFITDLFWANERLYVATRSGLYTVQGEATRLLFERPTSGVLGAFVADAEGGLWLAHEAGLWALNGDSATLRVSGEELGLRAAISTPEGLLIGASTGVYRWADGALSKLADTPVRAFLPDPGGLLWGSEEGILIDGGEALPGSRRCFVTDLARLPDGRVVASCGEGILVQAPEGPMESVGRKNGLPASIVTRALVDRDGQLWLGTLEHGLLRIAHPDLRLWDTAGGFPSPHITHMTPSGDALYLSTRHGALRIDADLQPHPHPVMGKETLELLSVLALPDGALLWSWSAHGLVLQRGPRERLLETEQSAGQLFLDGGGEVFAVNYQGVFAVNLESGQIEGLPKFERSDGSDIVVDPEGRVVFTTREHLVRLEDRQWVNAGPLPADCSNAELLLEEDLALFGCDGVLYRRDEAGWRTIERYGEGGLFAQFSQLGEETWIVMLGELARLGPRPMRLGPSRGLPPLIFTAAISPAYLGGWLFAATNEGLLITRPQSWERKSRPPDARILGFFAGDRALDSSGRVGADEELLRVELGAATLGERALVDFRFRLDGGEWSEPLDGATLFLPGLPHGAHGLEVQARYAGSEWSPSPARFPFTIDAHWYERRSVQVAAVALLLAGAVFLRSERTRRLRAQVEQLQEREAFRQVFGRFVDPRVAEVALSGKLSEAGEKRDVTVLFADIQGFTPLTESMPASELVALLNTWLTAMVAAIEREGGVVNKFAGDSVVAIFGAPIPQPDHADRAVRAAIGMCEAGHELAGELERRFGRRIRAGIGVNSGEVIAGPVGAASRMEYTVIGEAVNVAARVEALTRALGQEVLVTEATRQRLSGTMSLVRCGAHALKGVSQPVEVWALSGLSDPPG